MRCESWNLSNLFPRQSWRPVVAEGLWLMKTLQVSLKPPPIFFSINGIKWWRDDALRPKGQRSLFPFIQHYNRGEDCVSCQQHPYWSNCCTPFWVRSSMLLFSWLVLSLYIFLQFYHCLILKRALLTSASLMCFPQAAPLTRVSVSNPPLRVESLFSRHVPPCAFSFLFSPWLAFLHHVSKLHQSSSTTICKGNCWYSNRFHFVKDKILSMFWSMPRFLLFQALKGRLYKGVELIWCWSWGVRTLNKSLLFLTWLWRSLETQTGGPEGEKVSKRDWTPVQEAGISLTLCLGVKMKKMKLHNLIVQAGKWDISVE